MRARLCVSQRERGGRESFTFAGAHRSSKLRLNCVRTDPVLTRSWGEKITQAQTKQSKGVRKSGLLLLLTPAVTSCGLTERTKRNSDADGPATKKTKCGDLTSEKNTFKKSVVIITKMQISTVRRSSYIVTEWAALFCGVSMRRKRIHFYFYSICCFYCGVCVRARVCWGHKPVHPLD